MHTVQKSTKVEFQFKIDLLEVDKEYRFQIDVIKVDNESRCRYGLKTEKDAHSAKKY